MRWRKPPALGVAVIAVTAVGVRPGSGDGLVTASWRQGTAREAIIDFVAQVGGAARTTAGPIDQRVAVFDNDGTLRCEKPMPIQLDFILRRLTAMALADPAVRDRQPWKAAHERDYDWLNKAMTDHYAGDDST